MARNLSEIIPAFFTGPGGARLTPEQIAQRRAASASMIGQATDTSPNAGGVASILTKALLGGMAGYDARTADNAIGANAEASRNNIASLLSGLTGSTGGMSQGATVASPVVGGGQSASVPQTVDISGDKQTFIQSLLPAAIEEGARTGVDPRIIVAQAAQETGWGKSAPGNNYFGIKSHGQSGGQTLATNEVIDGKTVRINDSFRQFESPADSVRGYGDFILQNPRYKPLREAQGIDAQLQALQASGYATDPNYSRSVGAIARSIQLPQSSTDPMVSAQPSNAVASAQAIAPQPAMTAPAQQPLNPAVIEALSSPYASEQERSVAGLLLNQHMSQQQAAQQQALAQQQRQQEIARRQQIAQQAGIDPAYAQDDELWKGATGNVFAAPSTSTANGNVVDNRTGKVIFSAPPTPTTNMQDYQFYADRETAAGRTPLGPLEYEQALRSSGAARTNIDTGTVPQGYQAVRDEQGRLVRYEPVPGGPADTTKLNEKAAVNTQRSGNIVLEDVDRAVSAIENNPTLTTGIIGNWSKGVGGTPANKVNNLLQTVRANSAFDRLQQMREASPTGGALGAVSDSELGLLQNAIGSLEQSNDSEDLVYNLRRVQEIYEDIIYGPEDAKKLREERKKGINQPENPLPEQNSGWKDVGNGVRIRPKGGN